MRTAQVAGTAILTGEMFAAMAALFFDRDRDDSSLEEIAKTWDRKKEHAIGKLAERALNDIMLGGMLGILGQPLDFYKSWFQGSRFRNPLEPPAGVIPNSSNCFSR